MVKAVYESKEMNSSKLEHGDKLDKIYKYNYSEVKDYGFYDPLMVGSIDGTDEKPHDHGIVRALNANHYKPNLSNVSSDPHKTLFIGRINYKTSEETLQNVFTRFGSIKSLRLVRDVITAQSKGYAFIEYKHRSDAKKAYHDAFKIIVDDRELLVDFEHDRELSGWVPRRMGGGLGGFKESGQLRFGSRYKPFGKVFRTTHRSSDKF